METFDLRDMVVDEVEYQKLAPSIDDKVVLYIKNRSKLLESLDCVVTERPLLFGIIWLILFGINEGICAVCAKPNLEVD